MKTGDLCPKCGDHVKVLDTKRVHGLKVRYYGCRYCGWRPPENKQVVGNTTDQEQELPDMMTAEGNRS